MATAQSTALSRATAPTAASRAKANENDVDAATQGKRKRDALAQVPKNANKAKSALAPKDVKGKANDPPSAKGKFDGVVIKSRAPSTGNRQPLSIVAATRRTAKATAPQSKVRPLTDVKEDVDPAPVHIDDAMAVDAAPSVPLTNAKRAYRPSTVTASNVIKHEVQRVDLSKRTTSHLNVKTRAEEDNRVFKKRRTSDDVPDEAKLFEQEDHDAHVVAFPDVGIDSELEADPNGDEWDDLDAEDGDDPLMVSEYVSEIFDYMKNVEVCASHVDSPHPADPFHSLPRSLIRTTCQAKRNWRGQCEGSCSTGSSRFTPASASSPKPSSCVSTSSTVSCRRESCRSQSSN